ncbi:MAG TPA: hypothetical protein VKW06_18355 [Candidatus Angelobacter sp.]|nr:hypothetical protein [Candidatus Angelobacter sp.]
MPDDKIDGLEGRIRALCAKVVKSSDEDTLRSMCADLRTMLNEHIEFVRSQARELKIRQLEAQLKIKEMDSKKSQRRN